MRVIGWRPFVHLELAATTKNEEVRQHPRVLTFAGCAENPAGQRCWANYPLALAEKAEYVVVHLPQLIRTRAATPRLFYRKAQRRPSAQTINVASSISNDETGPRHLQSTRCVPRQNLCHANCSGSDPAWEGAAEFVATSMCLRCSTERPMFFLIISSATSGKRRGGLLLRAARPDSIATEWHRADETEKGQRRDGIARLSRCAHAHRCPPRHQEQHRACHLPSAVRLCSDGQTAPRSAGRERHPHGGAARGGRPR